MMLFSCLASPELLYASAKNCGCTICRELHEAKPQMQGEDVLELQCRLQQLSFFQGTSDGIYDKETADAVRSFQKAQKQQVTGRVDQATWTALGKGCESPATALPKSPPDNVNIIVDLERLTLTVREGERDYYEFPIAAGKPETPSPIGEWKIVNKAYDNSGPFGTRWMGLSVPWGSYGIHGTDRPWSIGSSASAGCIRMFNEDVNQVFEWASEGTPVKIQAPFSWMAGCCTRTLEKDASGPDVVYAQLLLKETGFFPYDCDNWYGYLTELAVRSYQLHHGLPTTGEVDEKVLMHLEEKVGVFEQS
ncbi:MAG: peptidoglycan-binding protein [Syntrophaceticus sp.]|jgi:peptidoglycan hydrolase-like protein with peptidoglycan-binding domain|nr:peptidoglycan-binding protein [Syntrophaceticus sp.]MDD4783402.1 peptidoglycan-binding protein [Syntrophaceticus sp.]